MEYRRYEVGFLSDLFWWHPMGKFSSTTAAGFGYWFATFWVLGISFWWFEPGFGFSRVTIEFSY